MTTQQKQQYLARIRPYHLRDTSVETNFEELDPMLHGVTLPLPDMNRTSTSVSIGPRAVSHKRGKGRSIP